MGLEPQKIAAEFLRPNLETASEIVATNYGIRLSPKRSRILDFIFTNPGQHQKQIAYQFYPDSDIDRGSLLVRVYVNKLNKLLYKTPVRIRSKGRHGYGIYGLPEH